MQEDPRRRLLRAICGLWAVVPEWVDRYEALNRPQLQAGSVPGSQCCVGRALLPQVAGRDQATLRGLAEAASGSGREGGGSGSFARTGHSMRMMERLAVCLQLSEPALLVGETGTGKTTLAQQIARQCGAKLVVLNLSQQTDSSDLLGGFKPVDARDALLPLLPRFGALVRWTWPRGNNDEFMAKVTAMAERRKWAQLLKAFQGAAAKVEKEFPSGNTDPAELATAVDPDSGRPSKKKAKARALPDECREEWSKFLADVRTAERAATVSEGGFAFAFVEGALVQAVREGWWLLLDEINLAPAEVLERISGLLEATEGASGSSIVLAERGDVVPIPRHPSFRLMAAMNPATDAGKRDLPAPLRNRFTELYVPEPSTREDLRELVRGYLQGIGVQPPIDQVVDFYIQAKQEAEGGALTDGAGHRPSYSLRTLCRALEYVRASAPLYGLERSLYDGFAMSFLTQLGAESERKLARLMRQALLRGRDPAQTNMLRAPPEPPGGGHVLFDCFWVERGERNLPREGAEADGQGRTYVQTATVKEHLRNLSRAVVLRKYPILLQGPTSSGKTSLVAYLAAQTGHTFVRINNHEQTDLQEYLGSYVSDENGRLVFREGLLVQAVRHGHWIVLDELNLAPTEVLEALNRLLDDNRELFVPELQETIKPHPHFMLFATQNPPGAYAGRKVLSRAFRSRFLELHVDDIPDDE